MSSPVKGFGPNIYALTPGELSALMVAGLSDSQRAFVNSNRYSYVLQDAVGVADGSFVLDTLDDVGRQWVIEGFSLNPTPGNVVETFNGAHGNVQFFPTLMVANVAALAAAPTTSPSYTYSDGQLAFVKTTHKTYKLQAKISTAPDNVFVVATPDDVTRQWVDIMLYDGCGLPFITPELDFTQIQTVTCICPLTGLKAELDGGIRFTISQKDGTVTTGPTTAFGTSATFDNMFAATVQPAVTTQAVNTTFSPAGAASPFPAEADLSNGTKMKITIGAVRGTATVIKGRFEGNFWIHS